MSKAPKDIVRDFYESNFLKDEDFLNDFFHPGIELIWNSADGLSVLRYKEIVAFFEEIKRSYDDLRIEISHLLSEDENVTIRYKYYIRTLENPDEELGIAHFIAIWEIKDNKLYRGYQVSQPVTEKDDITEIYKKVKL